MKKITFLLFILLVVGLFVTFVGSSCSKPVQYYTNPVIHGDMADPSIIRIGKTYYATGTSSEWAPFYPMFTSTDLVNWTQTGFVFEKQPEWTVSSFWAPELFYHNDKVYCYYTARRKSDRVSYIGVAMSNSPTEEFTDHGLLVEFGKEAIDAFVFDDNGQLYITWKAYGLDSRPIEIMGSKLSTDGLHLEGEPFSLLVDDENIGMEGQYHFKQGDFYYIIYATHGCCGPGSDYKVAVARSKSFKGPYEKYAGNPVLYGGDDYISCGHGTVVTSPDGRMFYLCHAYLKNEGFYQGRQPILQEMKINDEGWIYFPTGEKAVREQPMPFPGTIQKPLSGLEDDFKNEKLRNEWTWNYPFSDMHYEIRNGNLYLSGAPKENNFYGTALCIKSVSPNYSYETQVIGKNCSFKGLTMYGDNENLIFLAFADDKILLKSVKDGNEQLIYETKCDSDNVNFKVEVTRGCFCTFLWSIDGANWNIINSEPLDVGWLVRWDRVARPGLIHIGEVNEPAIFSYYKLEIKN